MADKLKYIFLLLICLSARGAFAQFNTPYGNGQNPQQRPANFADTAHKTTQQLTSDQELDTIRAKEEKARDSVIFTSKFILIYYYRTQETLDEGVQKMRKIYKQFDKVGIKDRSMIWNS